MAAQVPAIMSQQAGKMAWTWVPLSLEKSLTEVAHDNSTCISYPELSHSATYTCK